MGATRALPTEEPRGSALVARTVPKDPSGSGRVAMMERDGDTLSGGRELPARDAVDLRARCPVVVSMARRSAS